MSPSTHVFTTEPYETAWAAEARWFVHVLEASPGARLEVAAEVSPEGITWCGHEARPVDLQGQGLVTLALDPGRTLAAPARARVRARPPR